VGLDHTLAHNCSRDSGCDFLAREVSEGAAVVLDTAVWMAFLERVCRARLAPAVVSQLDFRRLDGEEALIEKCIPKNIARRQLNWRNEVVFERGLFASSEAHDVRGRVPAVLFA